MKKFKQTHCCLPIFLGRGEGVNFSHNAAFDPTASKSSSFSVVPPSQARLPWDLSVAIDGSLTFAFVSLPRQRLPAATPGSSALLARGEAEGAKTPCEGARGSPSGEREGGQSQKHRLASTTRAAFRAGWQLGPGGARGKEPLLSATGSQVCPQMNQASELLLCKSCSCCTPR